MYIRIDTYMTYTVLNNKVLFFDDDDDDDNNVNNNNIAEVDAYDI